MQNSIETSNTIQPVAISGEEYVIIKNFKKKYEKKRQRLVSEIYKEIIEDLIKEKDLKNTEVNNL